MLLIGKTINVKGAINPQLVGKSGRVVDETKETIKLHNGITLIKNHITIEETT